MEAPLSNRSQHDNRVLFLGFGVVLGASIIVLSNFLLSPGNQQTLQAAMQSQYTRGAEEMKRMIERQLPDLCKQVTAQQSTSSSVSSNAKK